MTPMEFVVREMTKPVCPPQTATRRKNQVRPMISYETELAIREMLKTKRQCQVARQFKLEPWQVRAVVRRAARES